ncbi:hypothetical protein GCM10009768_24620 [Leucobacter iarius]|uniref:Uncharacterized protein n=1 Tax=Leucobacter iarius TaxID=333963 RepID=A0ABN2LN95_9MICO
MWTWDWSQPFSVPGLLWGVLTDVLLPAIAIVTAAWVVSRQTRETTRAQLEVMERADLDRQRDRWEEGIGRAVEAMHELNAVPFRSRQERALARARAGSALSTISVKLGPENAAVSIWIMRELSVVGESLDNEDEDGWPLAGDLITTRAASFVQCLSDWLMGTRPASWFASQNELPSTSIEDTTLATPFDASATNQSKTT